jgi:hypothetical protein
LFYSNFFVWSWFVFFCVGDSKKKNLITTNHKGHKKKQPKAQERELRFSTVFCTRERICISAKRAAIAKLSLVLLRLFFFRRSVLFHHKDRCILERVLFFSDLARVFFPLFLLKKKERQIFLRSFREVGPQQMPLVRTVLPRSRAAVNEKSLIFNHAQTFWEGFYWGKQAKRHTTKTTTRQVKKWHHHHRRRRRSRKRRR